MGFGQRVYRTRDPRADVLKGIVRDLKESNGAHCVCGSVEWCVLDVRYPNRHLDTNINIYKALVLDGVCLPCELFTPAFEIGRVLG